MFRTKLVLQQIAIVTENEQSVCVVSMNNQGTNMYTPVILRLLCMFEYSDVQHSVLSHVFTFWVPCCDVRHNFRIAHLFVCVVFFALFVFVLCLVYPMLPVSLDCTFLISYSVSL
jgi:hypothetical protein